MPDEALEELFGFVANQCIAYLDGEQLDSLKKLNDKFYEFDSWEIYDDKEGVLATKKEKNEIKRVIMQSCLGNKRKTYSACLRNKRKTQDTVEIACLRYKRKATAVAV